MESILKMERKDFQQSMITLGFLEAHGILTYDQWNKLRSKLITYYHKEGYEYAT